MNQDQKNQLEKLFSRFPEIGIVYLFGSHARGEAGLMSDYDFAIYFDERNKKRLFEFKAKLLDVISRIFKVLIEPRILNEYFDFKMLLQKYNLTQAL